MLKKGAGLKWGILVVAAVAITIAFFVSRLSNLTVIPIFTDEAIYLRWAQIAAADPRWRFISLIDGKQPLLIWLFLTAYKLTTADPLVVGRLISIGCGFIAMTGLAAFAWYLTRSRKAMVIGALTYLIIPFFLFYDRLAIYEALFNALTVWTLFALYVYGRTLRFDAALLTGSLIGFGLLTKSYANFFLILLPATLLMVRWTKAEKVKTFIRWLALSLVIIVQAQIYHSILRLSEFRHIVEEKNLQFIYSVSEFIKDPFVKAGGNLRGMAIWLVSYLTLPLAVLVLGAAVWYTRRNLRQGLFFLTFFAVPFVALGFFGKVIYPRFLLFMLPSLLLPLILLFAQWRYDKRIGISAAVICLILLPSLLFDFRLLTDPVRAPLPTADRQQFINDWPAGYGIREVVDFLERESQKGPLVVGTEGTFGLFPHALELYLGKNENVTVKAYWPLNEFPPDLSESARQKPTYLIFKERQTAPEDWPLELVSQYQRGDGPTYLKFFRVLPPT